MATSSSEFEGLIAEILLDQNIRLTFEPHLELWMFTKKLWARLVESIMHKDFSGRSINSKTLQVHMQVRYPDLLSHEWEMIEALVSGFKGISSNDLQAVTSTISTFIRDRLHQRGIDLYTKGQKEEAQNFLLRATTFRITANPFVNPNEAGILDILKAKDLPPGGHVIRSSIGLVNQVAQYGGYKNADLIMVVGRPKGGKTTLMIQEGAIAAFQGFNVAHMFFGDQSEFDGICKYMSCSTGDAISNVVQNHNAYLKKCERLLDHVRIASFPAMQVDCLEIVSHLTRLKKTFNFSLAVLDYDSNIRPSNDAGMYETGGIMYSSFKGFGMTESCAVMVGSQPKIQYWNDEILGMESASESSRKQHAVDFMLCIGRNPTYNKAGTVNIPLVRRGESAHFARVMFDDVHSRITDVTPENYDRIIRDYKEKRKQGASDTSILEGMKFGSDKETFKKVG